MFGKKFARGLAVSATALTLVVGAAASASAAATAPGFTQNGFPAIDQNTRDANVTVAVGGARVSTVRCIWTPLVGGTSTPLPVWYGDNQVIRAANNSGWYIRQQVTESRTATVGWYTYPSVPLVRDLTVTVPGAAAVFNSVVITDSSDVNYPVGSLQLYTDNNGWTLVNTGTEVLASMTPDDPASWVRAQQSPEEFVADVADDTIVPVTGEPTTVELEDADVKQSANGGPFFVTDGTHVWTNATNAYGVFTYTTAVTAAAVEAMQQASSNTDPGPFQTESDLVVKQGGDPVELFVTNGTDVWTAPLGSDVNNPASWTEETRDEKTVEWVEGLPVAQFPVTGQYHYAFVANSAVARTEQGDGYFSLVLNQGYVPVFDIDSLPAGQTSDQATIVSNNAGSPVPVAGATPPAGWPAGLGVNQGQIETQAQTNGFTGEASMPTVNLPEFVNNQLVTGARVDCQEWRQVNGVWGWQNIANAAGANVGTGSQLFSDTRPLWCRNATGLGNAEPNFMLRGQQLNAGQWLISLNCQWGLTVQASDGNVVLYQLNPTANANSLNIPIVGAVAATEQFHSEFNRVPSTLVFGNDGNVVQYIGALPAAGSANNAVAWTGSNPSGQALFVQNDGNVVVYAGGTPTNPNNPVWARYGLGTSNSGGQVESTIANSPNHFFAFNNVG